MRTDTEAGQLGKPPCTEKTATQRDRGGMGCVGVDQVRPTTMASLAQTNRPTSGKGQAQAKEKANLRQREVRQDMPMYQGGQKEDVEHSASEAFVLTIISIFINSSLEIQFTLYLHSQYL